MLLLRMNIETIKEDSVLNVDKTPVFTITYNQINNYFQRMMPNETPITNDEIKYLNKKDILEHIIMTPMVMEIKKRRQCQEQMKYYDL
jgi:hypothetical protein